MKSTFKVSPSKNFKKSIRKVIMALIYFMMLYLILIFLSIVLIIVCGVIAVEIIAAYTSIITLAAGAGLILLGLMLFFFLIKFVFKLYKDEFPFRIEITKKSYPELFALIDELTGKIGCKPPKKVFVRHDVNASVFYNSSFWSLFIPVKKNLDIGLGLVNSLSKKELKAVLAHEFGHFSQRSMKLGSYIYTVNNSIYNLVYDYDRWDRSLEAWANAGGVFGFFAVITYKIVELIRAILKESYNVINISYMKLSREMEYHADEIAAHVAGKENVISSLRKIEFCDIAFSTTLNNRHELSKSNKLLENLFESHAYMIAKQSKYYKIELDNGLPIISDKDLDVNSINPRVIYKDQWASHPSRTERESNVEKINSSNHDEDNLLAWTLFENKSDLQKKMTSLINDIEFKDSSDMKLLNIEGYISFITEQEDKNKLNDFYEGFYDNRLINTFNIEDIKESSLNGDLITNLKRVYSKKSVLKFKKLQSTQSDIATLKQIKGNEINTKYFEFDNKKYHKRNVDKIISQLEKEADVLVEEFKQIDKDAFIINHKIAEEKPGESYTVFVKELINLNEYANNCEEYGWYTNELGEFHNTIYTKTNWQEHEIKEFNQSLSRFEQKYKSHIKDIGVKNMDGISTNFKKIIDEYVDTNQSYIRISEFDADKFNELINIVYEVHSILFDNYWFKLKSLTDFQVSLYEGIGVTAEIE